MTALDPTPNDITITDPSVDEYVAHRGETVVGWIAQKKNPDGSRRFIRPSSIEPEWTRRDEVAVAALYYACKWHCPQLGDDRLEETASLAYRIADAMLAQRAKERT